MTQMTKSLTPYDDRYPSSQTDLEVPRGRAPSLMVVVIELSPGMWHAIATTSLTEYKTIAHYRDEGTLGQMIRDVAAGKPSDWSFHGAYREAISATAQNPMRAIANALDGLGMR